MIRAVFLDVGETIVDEDRAWGDWAAALGISRLTLFGCLGAAIERRIDHREVLRRFAAPERLDAIAQGLSPQIRPSDLYPDAVDCLAALRAAGYRVGLAGNQPAAAEALLAGLGLPVDAIASSAAWGVEKPAPAFFDRVVGLARVPAAEIAYVGDRVDNDVVPAAAAGMLAVHLVRGPWAHVQSAWPEASRAAAVIGSLAELPAVLAPA